MAGATPDSARCGCVGADLAAHQSRMAEIAAAERAAGVAAEETVAFEVASIADAVEIRAVLHVNQDDSRFGGRGNRICLVLPPRAAGSG